MAIKSLSQEYGYAFYGNSQTRPWIVLIPMLDEELEASKKKHARIVERMKTEAPTPGCFPAHVIERCAQEESI